MDEIRKRLVYKRLKKKVAQAEVLVYLIDAAADFSEDFEMLRSLLRDKLELIICLTKIDEVVPTQFEAIEDLFRKGD